MNTKLKWILILSFLNVQVYADDLSEKAKAKANEAGMEEFNKLLGANAPFVELKYFSPEGGDGSTSGYGLAYDWEKKANRPLTKIGKNAGEFYSNTFSAYAKGNYVFSDKNNPEDLSTLGLSYELMAANYAPITADEVLSRALADRLEDECYEDFQATRSEWCEATEGALRKITGRESSILWSIKVKADVQGNQDFTEKEYVYGMGATVRYTPAKDSPYRLLNLFELPFRYVTQALMDNGSLESSDRAFPVVHLGVDRVDPSDNSVRNDILSHKDHYERAYAEVGYVTTLGRFKGQSVKFNYHYRYFKELGASQAIEDVGMDRFRYAVYAIQIPGAAFNLDLPQTITLSYATGKLPFNRSSEGVFQIGFQSNVELGKVFGLD
jgi:hypothetical protein